MRTVIEGCYDFISFIESKIASRRILILEMYLSTAPE